MMLLKYFGFDFFLAPSWDNTLFYFGIIVSFLVLFGIEVRIIESSSRLHNDELLLLLIDSSSFKLSSEKID
jgi:hypothetical protein